jgi:hypothetical protein
MIGAVNGPPTRQVKKRLTGFSPGEIALAAGAYEKS